MHLFMHAHEWPAFVTSTCLLPSLLAPTAACGLHCSMHGSRTPVPARHAHANPTDTQAYSPWTRRKGEDDDAEEELAKDKKKCVCTPGSWR